jgi:hypothetical protein
VSFINATALCNTTTEYDPHSHSESAFLPLPTEIFENTEFLTVIDAAFTTITAVSPIATALIVISEKVHPTINAAPLLISITLYDNEPTDPATDPGSTVNVTLFNITGVALEPPSEWINGLFIDTSPFE